MFLHKHLELSLNVFSDVTDQYNIFYLKKNDIDKNRFSVMLLLKTAFFVRIFKIKINAPQ
jgi:hypothetical protein